jgi:hypothetical protein
VHHHQQHQQQQKRKEEHEQEETANPYMNRKHKGRKRGERGQRWMKNGSKWERE